MANKYKLVLTSRFRKDLKLIQKQHKDIEQLGTVVTKLLQGYTLDKKYADHALIGEWTGFRECHIKPDWLLIYFKNETELIITAVRTGTHAGLLNK